jgi:6-phosphofructokinase
MKKIAFLSSGGDSPGMNACIRAIVKSCLHYKITPIGIRDGFKGLMAADFFEMTYDDVDNIIHRGGTILGTARSKEFKDPEKRQVAIQNLIVNQIEGLIVIGGDGSFTGATILSQEMGIPIIGIPGTIDNDIYGTDHTIGYDTALNTVIEAIDKIRDTASSHQRVFFIEVMGRDAGFIAMIKKGLFEELGAKEIKQQRKTEDLKADYEKKLENQKKLLTLEKEEALKEQKAKSKKELDEVKGQIELLQVELLETKEALKKAQKELKEKA